ncbi:MAG: hypothetical protein LBS48_04820 [Treponema sp.]|jgi:hypothetical protein|nr:hypothetical protein [Treponema sp.]
MAVTEVIITDESDPARYADGKFPVIARAVINGSRWRTELHFTSGDNGRKIAAVITAYDRMRNAGENSIQTINLIVDTSPPVFSGVEIVRSSTYGTLGSLAPGAELTNLEQSDPLANDSANVDRYQNGWFYIRAHVSEMETNIGQEGREVGGEIKQIDMVYMDIYDADHDTEDEVLLSGIPRDESIGMKYTPYWLIKTEDLITAGNAKAAENPEWLDFEGQNYQQRLDAGRRLYFRVNLKAVDLSGNPGEPPQEKVEQQLYFCILPSADLPRAQTEGLLRDEKGSIYVSKGTDIPVEVYDDDYISEGYVAMISVDQQWDVPEYFGWSEWPDGIFYPPEYRKDNVPEPEDLITAKKDRLLELLRPSEENPTPDPVYDWTNAKNPADITGQIKDRYKGKTLREDMIFVKTGNEDSDYGAYKLIMFVQDTKSAPHTEDAEAVWTKNIADIFVSDENAPLIVFDTVKVEDGGKGSPEENTFPALDADGRSFTLYGYTLDENRLGYGGVDVVRMAWIPYNIPGGADSQVSQVRAALADGGNDLLLSLLDDGIRFWTWYADGSGMYNLTEGVSESIGEIPYRRQEFELKLDILEDFKYNAESPYDPASGTLENEAKLFVVYTRDLQNHGVYRTLRLLGNKKPPALTVFDETSRVTFTVTDTNNDGKDDANHSTYNGNIADAGYTSAKVGYPPLEILPPTDISVPFQTYARGTVLKYYVKADFSGDLSIANITMQDVTETDNPRSLGEYIPFDRESPDTTGYLVYYEDLETEITQRVFLFTAEDILGNKAEAQRTIAVTSTAYLQQITSPDPNGSYGIGQELTIRGVFSAPIQVTRGDNSDGTDENDVPVLHLYYTDSAGYEVDEPVRYAGPFDTPTLYLDFKFAVPEGARSLLASSSPGNSNSIPITLNGNSPDPIIGSANIVDVGKASDAFIPGSSHMAAWNAVDPRNLQGATPSDGKKLNLDGVKPEAGSFAVSGKTPYSTNPNIYHFKTNETILFTLKTQNADVNGNAEALRVNGNPAIRFTIGGAGPFYAGYLRPENSGQDVVFSYDVTASNNGKITVTGLGRYTGGVYDDHFDESNNITDAVGNYLADPDFGTLYTDEVYVDTAAPAAPVILLGPGAAGNDGVIVVPGSSKRYNYRPELTIMQPGWTAYPADPAGPATIAEPYETRVEYSLDSGLTWTEYYPTLNTGTGALIGDDDKLRIDAGTWHLTVRQTDPAGNVTDPVPAAVTVEIKDVFPRLVSVSLEEPNGTYTGGSDANKTVLHFNLDFADSVLTTSAAGDARAYIIICDPQYFSESVSSPAHPEAFVKIYADVNQTAPDTTTISFTWNITDEITDEITGSAANAKQMAKIAVKEIHLQGGVVDSFGNEGVNSHEVNYAPGGAGVITMNGDTAGTVSQRYPVEQNLNGDGVEVDAIVPELQSASPANANSGGPAYSAAPEATVMDAGITDNFVTSGNDTITLTFSEAMEKGMGTITVKPHGEFYIPPVLTNTEFYTIYNSDFYDYEGNNKGKLMEAADANEHKEYLTRSTNASDPTMYSLRTTAREGYSYGPYKQLTHGLKVGTGFTGSQLGTGPDRLIPDTSIKWVLDYRYEITGALDPNSLVDLNGDGTNDVALTDFTYFGFTGKADYIKKNNEVVTGIRKALKAARYRWAQVDVISSDVTIIDNKVTIKLPRTLEAGLEWDLYYDEGTFTDKAGNPAAGISDNGDFWFRSAGVQAPVIRVNRISYDARSGGTTGDDYYDITTTIGNNYWANTYGPMNANWNGSNMSPPIATFNRAAYRIDCETIGAAIESGVHGHTGTMQATTTFTNTATAENNTWETTTTGTPGQNVVRYFGTNNTSTTTIYVGANSAGQGDFRGRRSFNQDALLSAVKGVGMTTTLSESGVQSIEYSTTGQPAHNGNGSTEVPSLLAAKDYVTAAASVSYGSESFTSPRGNNTSRGVLDGYEGVFRSVLMIAQPAIGDKTNYRVQGSNVQNANPTIPGFPVHDNDQTDWRFSKYTYKYTTGNPGNYLWVSTDIVSPWYIIIMGLNNGVGGHVQRGMVKNYLYAGYGDVFMSYNQ